MKIYPSITTITKGGWIKKVEEIKNFGIKEVCLFPTSIASTERRRLYKALEVVGVKKIPLVHLRDDMDLLELVWLKKRFRVDVFNIHVGGKHPNKNNYGKENKYIYVENSTGGLSGPEIKRNAGICLDVAHLEADRLFRRSVKYKNVLRFIKKYQVGVAHVSAVSSKKVWIDGVDVHDYAMHEYKKLGEFDYLLRYEKYLPEILALELENSIKEQLVAKEYIEKLLKIK